MNKYEFEIGDIHWEAIDGNADIRGLPKDVCFTISADTYMDATDKLEDVLCDKYGKGCFPAAFIYKRTGIPKKQRVSKKQMRKEVGKILERLHDGFIDIDTASSYIEDLLF